MCTNGVTKSDLLSWIAKSIKKENFFDYEIILQGKIEKGDGYMGELIFARVIGTTRENDKRELNLVVKHGKSNDHLRRVAPVRAAFEVEIHFDSQIIPAFRKLQDEHKIMDIFKSVPKCYETLLLENMEVLVLGNLKALGFELYDKKTSLNFEHQKKVLTEYGKLHALIFALQDQKTKELNDLTNIPNVTLDFFNDESTKKSFQDGINDAWMILEERKEVFLLQKLKKRLHKSAADLMIDFVSEEISDGVTITHGDCWNNNFMYKYEVRKSVLHIGQHFSCNTFHDL